MARHESGWCPATGAECTVCKDYCQAEEDEVSRDTEPRLHLVQEYVVGYCFNPNVSQVLLILKNRPDWLKGCWNGVGGKVEYGETALAAMVREFEEEAGVKTSPVAWTPYFSIQAKDYYIHYYYMSDAKVFQAARAMTDEQVRRTPCGGKWLGSFYHNLSSFSRLTLPMAEYLARKGVKDETSAPCLWVGDQK